LPTATKIPPGRRPTEVGEYSFILRQLRKNRDPELVVCGVYRLALPDGSAIVVTGAQGFQPKLFGVLPPDWQVGDPMPWQRNPPGVRPAAEYRNRTVSAVNPEPRPARALPVLVSQPAPAAAPKPPPRRPTTLSLSGNRSEAAAELLEYRKRRWG
jgi:hypothetical protein